MAARGAAGQRLTQQIWATVVDCQGSRCAACSVSGRDGAHDAFIDDGRREPARPVPDPRPHQRKSHHDLRLLSSDYLAEKTDKVKFQQFPRAQAGAGASIMPGVRDDDWEIATTEVEPSRGYAAAFLSSSALLGSGRHCEDASTKAESTTRDLVLAELGRGQFAHRKCLSRIPACFRRAISFSDSQPGVTSSDAASA